MGAILKFKERADFATMRDAVLDYADDAGILESDYLRPRTD